MRLLTFEPGSKPRTVMPTDLSAMPTSTALADTRGRHLRDLRISVTDRCNFRCTYCMPKEVYGRDFQFLERSQLLTFDEIHRLITILKGHGIEKVRITGGEPLVRRQLERLIEMLAIDPELDLTLTTNAALLKQKAQLLKDATKTTAHTGAVTLIQRFGSALTKSPGAILNSRRLAPEG